MRDASEAFFIQHLDSLGQGVCKLPEGKILLVPKTLPGEKGIAQVIRTQGKVSFASGPQSLSETSPQRQNPKCKHYQHCAGCDYLHTSYEQEIQFKKNALLHLFDRQKFIIPDRTIHVAEAQSRFQYRNRIQLHYNSKAKILGLLGENNKIIAIPDCQLPRNKVFQKMQELYRDQSWLALIAEGQLKESGHLEIYEKADGQVYISWNDRYASGGFSQVNPDMNDRLVEIVARFISEIAPASILELFGGNGNLTQNCHLKSHLSIDFSPMQKLGALRETPDGRRFMNLDLYDRDAMSKLAEIKKESFSMLLLDPPRSGMKNLLEFSQTWKPKDILYISCWPSTMLRDLQTITPDYQLARVHLVDMFPGTHHFETIVHLKKS